MSQGIKGAVPCALFGGPLDGAKYGDLPDIGTARDSATRQITLASAIAAIVHKGHVVKAGSPSTHIARVASKFDPSEMPVLHAAAWLHDVVEDSTLTLADLRGIGIHRAVLTIVDLLTPRPHIDTSEYYRRIAALAGACAVKRADIDDNTDLERMARLQPSVRARLTTKYERAKLALAEGGE